MPLDLRKFRNLIGGFQGGDPFSLGEETLNTILNDSVFNKQTPEFQEMFILSIAQTVLLHLKALVQNNQVLDEKDLTKYKNFYNELVNVAKNFESLDNGSNKLSGCTQAFYTELNNGKEKVMKAEPIEMILPGRYLPGISPEEMDAFEKEAENIPDNKPQPLQPSKQAPTPTPQAPSNAAVQEMMRKAENQAANQAAKLPKDKSDLIGKIIKEVSKPNTVANQFKNKLFKMAYGVTKQDAANALINALVEDKNEKFLEIDVKYYKALSHGGLGKMYAEAKSKYKDGIMLTQESKPAPGPQKK